MTRPVETARRTNWRSVSGGWLVLLLLGLLCGCGSTQAPAPPPPPPPTAPSVVPSPPPFKDGGGAIGEGAPPPIRPPKDGAPAAADGGGVAGVPSPPRYHGYALFAAIDAEPQGYGMYTYILSSNLSSSTRPETDDIRKRYDALLRAIGGRTSSVAALTAARTSAGETNLFCIPAKAGSASDTPSLENYNPQLAVIYRLLVERQLASEAIRRSLENHTGPFLVSSLSRLTQARPGAPLLFADLSNSHSDAMQEVVAVYEQRVSQAPLERAEVFKPFKLALLNVILNGNDYVQIEKVAIAGILPPAESHR